MSDNRYIEDDGGEVWSDEGVFCPHCKAFHDPADSEGDFYREGDHKEQCGSCGKSFDLNVYVSHSWTTQPEEQSE